MSKETKRNMSVLPASQIMDNVEPEQIKTVIQIGFCSIVKLTNVLFQFKDFLISYNKLSELCFNDCATDFTTRAVKPHEVSHFKRRD